MKRGDVALEIRDWAATLSGSAATEKIDREREKERSVGEVRYRWRIRLYPSSYSNPSRQYTFKMLPPSIFPRGEESSARAGLSDFLPSALLPLFYIMLYAYGSSPRENPYKETHLRTFRARFRRVRGTRSSRSWDTRIQTDAGPCKPLL